MAWTLTDDIDGYAATVHDLLASDPERHTVMMSVLGHLVSEGPTTFGADLPVLGWWDEPRPEGLKGPGEHEDCEHEHCEHEHWEEPRGPSAALLWTPPHPAHLTRLAGSSAGELAVVLAPAHAARLTEVLGAEDDATAFASAWSALTGATSRVRQRQRLYRLGTLTPPDPVPEGTARVATLADEGVAFAWEEAFGAETGQHGRTGTAARERLRRGGLVLWEVDGSPAAMAAVTPAKAGVARVGMVYTPPELRARGYGGAVTVAATRLALERDADKVVLFTDLANPTSNALYQRLGYRPVEDRVMISFAPAPGLT
jgi:predicted GNAT family acetyltransferase